MDALTLIYVYVCIPGSFIPAALPRIFMDWLGVRLRRGRAICYVVAAGMLLSFLYAAVLNDLLGADASGISPFGIIITTVAILPSIILSW